MVLGDPFRDRVNQDLLPVAEEPNVTRGLVGRPRPENDLIESGQSPDIDREHDERAHAETVTSSSWAHVSEVSIVPGTSLASRTEIFVPPHPRLPDHAACRTELPQLIE